MSKTLAGRKPVAAKPTSGPSLNAPNFFTNKLSLPAGLIAELKAKNLDWRFINYVKYAQSGGQHKRGWTVYKPDGNFGFAAGDLLGQNPDGLIRRGGSVLAVRPMEYTEQHRSWLAQKNRALKGYKKAKADELRAMARESGADSIIDDQFDDDETDDS